MSSAADDDIEPNLTDAAQRTNVRPEVGGQELGEITGRFPKGLRNKGFERLGSTTHRH